MSPAKAHFSRHDIGELADRMEARGTSRMLRDRPELCKDVLAAAALLRWMLGNGMPVSSVEIEVNNGWAG